MPATDFAGQNPQLDLFSQHLPKKPYCTDNLDAGLLIRSLDTAALCRYIQPNCPNSRFCVVFDVDKVIYIEAILNDLNLPEPHLLVRNRENGHAHVFYFLETPVHLNPTSSLKPMRLLAALECAYTEALGADECYSGLIAKNPLHDFWDTVEGSVGLYDMGYMAEFVDLSAFNDARRRCAPIGAGRNVNLFTDLRCWSYRAIRQGWPDYDQWYQACLDRAVGLNKKNNPQSPLPYGEVRSTAKSVAVWVHRRFSPEAFSEIQSARGSKKGQTVREANLQRAIELSKAGWSQRMIAEKLEIGQSTISDWLRASKVTGSHIR